MDAEAYFLIAAKAWSAQFDEVWDDLATEVQQERIDWHRRALATHPRQPHTQPADH